MGVSAGGFCEALRGEGLAVPVTSTRDFHLALDTLDPLDFGDLYWAGRATLVRRIDQIGTYDRVFARYFGLDDLWRDLDEQVDRVVGLDREDADGPDGDEGGTEEVEPERMLRYSSVETLAHRDLASLTERERAEVAESIASLRVGAPSRRSARSRVARRGSGGVDLRRAVRDSMRTGGEIVRWPRRRRRSRARRIVLLVDVSGSMAVYSGALLRFAHAVTRAGIPTETFALGTRATRLSTALARRDPDAALRDAAERIEDWSGGTRLGDGLEAFLDGWGQRGAARGALVVILSDGWDRGDPIELGRQMQRLQRLAARIVWVNPLRASEGYEPLALGMAAALPYCDRFVDGHSLQALRELVAIVVEED